MEQRWIRRQPSLACCWSRSATPNTDKGFTLMITTNNPIKHAVTALLGAAVLVFSLTACNTIEGAGQDIKSTGKAIEKTADDNK